MCDVHVCSLVCVSVCVCERERERVMMLVSGLTVVPCLQNLQQFSIDVCSHHMPWGLSVYVCVCVFRGLAGEVHVTVMEVRAPQLA